MGRCTGPTAATGSFDFFFQYVTVVVVVVVVVVAVVAVVGGVGIRFLLPATVHKCSCSR